MIGIELDRPCGELVGKALAAALDCDREAGNFRRTLARLSKPGGPVESNQRNGYRLRQ
jgi:biotin operon repressor